MSPTAATFGRRLLGAALCLALVSGGCTSVTPPPSLGPTLKAPPSPGLSAPPTYSAGPSSTSEAANGSPTITPQGAPTPTASGSGGPTQSAFPPTPGATVDPAVASKIDAIVAQVPPIRELQPTKTVPYQVISRADFQSYLVSTENQDTTPEWRAAEERFLKRLGLLPQDANLEQLLLQLYTGEVAAYYNPADGHFNIISRDAPFGPVDEVTVAHEYTHALQDQHFDLAGTRIKDPAAGDAALSQLAVIEGDAVLTSQNWMRDNLTAQEQLQLVTAAAGQGSALDLLASMPLILRRQLEFPYTEGFMFTTSVWGLGGYNAVDQALQKPPASTEQILHDDKYYSQEAPVTVSAPGIMALSENGWANVYQQTMGELNIQVLAGGGEKPPIDIPGLPAQWPHAEVAAGWGGDHLNMYENASSGGWLIDWQTAWDTQADADEFVARMTELQSTFQGSVRLVNGPQTVRLVLASDPSLFLDLPSG